MQALLLGLASLRLVGLFFLHFLQEEVNFSNFLNNFRRLLLPFWLWIDGDFGPFVMALCDCDCVLRSLKQVNYYSAFLMAS